MNSIIHIPKTNLNQAKNIEFGYKRKQFRYKIYSLSLTLFLFLLLSSFNSQEHKIITDVAVSRVVMHPGFVFPMAGGVRFVNYNNYLTDWRRAKMFAVGFDSNNINDYDKFKKGVQDNCYWDDFGQSKYNKANFIEYNYPNLPDSLLNIESIVGNQRAEFSLGDLVALYGDYRRTVFADANADCYLTQNDNNVVRFRGTHPDYCTPEISTIDYLHKIAFGLVPPHGTLGNEFGNIATDAATDEAAWWGEEMMRLANVNETHFSDVAIAWYTGMHNMALYYVERAYQEPKYWKQALHYEASALHCLTDLFAFGHVVTHREESSYGMMNNNNLLFTTPNLWMENIIRMGGGIRQINGIVALSPNIPNPIEAPNVRNDFMKSYRGNWTLWAKREHEHHNKFNESGALVRNFRGDIFEIYGDEKLPQTNIQSRRVIEDAVTASIQSLFDYYNLINYYKSNQMLYSSEDLRNWYKYYWYRALRYVPVFIIKNKDNTLNGTWTSYAGNVKAMFNLTLPKPMPVTWQNCRIPFMNGNYNTNSLIQKLNGCSQFVM
jgi:hypothetical protein